MVIAAGKIYSGDAQFRRDEGNIAERALRSLESLAGDVSLEVKIGATVENGVIDPASVKLDNEFELVEFIGQLMLLVSKAESFSTDTANFFVTCKEQPRFDLRGTEDIAESENAAPIVAANALRAHQNISVSACTNVANWPFVNGVEMSDEHDEAEN